MGFSVAGIDAPSGVVILPSRGVWTARIALATDAPPALGVRVAAQAGSLPLSGVVRARGVHTSSAEVELLGGAGGWRKSVSHPTFRADNGVRLSEVVRALTLKVGETSVLETGAERVLGYAWNIADGPAATALEDLTGGAWWVAPDGVTHVGIRPTGARITAPWSVVRPPMASGFLVFSTPAEDLAAFPVGGELVGEGLLEPFVIGSLEIRWAASTVRLSAWRR